MIANRGVIFLLIIVHILNLEALNYIVQTPTDDLVRILKEACTSARYLSNVAKANNIPSPYQVSKGTTIRIDCSGNMVLMAAAPMTQQSAQQLIWHAKDFDAYIKPDYRVEKATMFDVVNYNQNFKPFKEFQAELASCKAECTSNPKCSFFTYMQKEKGCAVYVENGKSFLTTSDVGIYNSENGKLVKVNLHAQYYDAYIKPDGYRMERSILVDLTKYKSPLLEEILTDTASCLAKCTNNPKCTFVTRGQFVCYLYSDDAKPFLTKNNAELNTDGSVKFGIYWKAAEFVSFFKTDEYLVQKATLVDMTKNANSLKIFKASLDTCKAECWLHPKCSFFLYHQKSQACLLYAEDSKPFLSKNDVPVALSTIKAIGTWQAKDFEAYFRPDIKFILQKGTMVDINSLKLDIQPINKFSSTLDNCQEVCRAMTVACSFFIYTSKSQTCSLYAENVKPYLTNINAQDYDAYIRPGNYDYRLEKGTLLEYPMLQTAEYSGFLSAPLSTCQNICSLKPTCSFIVWWEKKKQCSVMNSDAKPYLIKKDVIVTKKYYEVQLSESIIMPAKEVDTYFKPDDFRVEKATMIDMSKTANSLKTFTALFDDCKTECWNNMKCRIFVYMSYTLSCSLYSDDSKPYITKNDVAMTPTIEPLLMSF